MIRKSIEKLDCGSLFLDLGSKNTLPSGSTYSYVTSLTLALSTSSFLAEERLLVTVCLADKISRQKCYF